MHAGYAGGMAALIWPVAVLVIFGVIVLVTMAKWARDAVNEESTLPLDPYERRAEEKRRLMDEHEAAEPEHTTHPARRP